MVGCTKWQRVGCEGEGSSGGRALQQVGSRIRAPAQRARQNSNAREGRVNPSGRHVAIEVDVKEMPALDLRGSPRALLEALDEECRVPTFVVDAVTQIPGPHWPLVLAS